MSAQLDKIEDLYTRIKDAKRAYLQSFGWKETCETPASYWLYERDFSELDAIRNKWADDHDKPHPRQYGLVCVPLDIAVSMTRTTLEL